MAILEPGFRLFVARLGRAGMSATLRLIDESTAPLSISNLAATPSDQFRVTSTTCAATLAGGQSCDITVEFTANRFGLTLGQLTVTDNASNSPQSSTLLGIAF